MTHLRFEPREIALRDGRLARLRELRSTDAAGMLAVERALHEDGRGMVLSRDQVAADVDAQAARMAPWIAATEAASGSVAIVAEVEGRVAASATLDRLRPGLVRHVGVLALGVAPAFQGLGLGRALLSALIEHGRRAGLGRLELYVRADNDRARALYQSFGFELEGVRRKFVRLPEGTWVDDHVMGLLLVP